MLLAISKDTFISGHQAKKLRVGPSENCVLTEICLMNESVPEALYVSKVAVLGHR